MTGPQHICGVLQEAKSPETAATTLSAPLGAATSLQHHDLHSELLLPAAGPGTPTPGTATGMTSRTSVP